MTNDQIEKALELCAIGNINCERQCPYSGNGCVLKLTKDALAYMRDLKGQIALLTKNAVESSNKPQEGRKLYVNGNGRYAIDEWTEFHCGDGIDIFVDDEWFETSIEAVDGNYYAVGMEGIRLEGFYAKPHRGVRL